MAEAYWRYNDPRQQHIHPPPTNAPLPLKRPRSDYDVPGGHELPGYFSREDGRTGYPMIRETDTIGSSYDRYLRSGHAIGVGGGESGRSLGGGMIGHSVNDMRINGARDFDPMARKSLGTGISGGKPKMLLPPDASNTLFVEGLPANCTKREVSHIFRPFVGFREVRLVTKEARRPREDPLVLCFVDFDSPVQAATAMDALQGYKFDEHEHDSETLRLQFSIHPGPRSGGKPRGRR